MSHSLAGVRGLLVLATVLGGAPSRAAAARSREAPAPPPREVTEISIEPAAESARAGETLAIVVRLGDDGGAPADTPDFVLEAFPGSIGPIERVGPGTVRAVLTVPERLPRARSALLVARRGRGIAERSIPLVSGPTRTLEILGPSDAALGDANGLQLTVSLVDAFGNATDEEPRASGGAGPLPTRRVAPGLWVVDYRPISVVDEADDVVTVDAGAAHGRHSLRLTRSDRWVAAAPWVGAVLGRSSGLALGASTSARWRPSRNELALVLDVGWWRVGDRARVALAGSPADFEGERTYLPLTASVAVGRRLTQRLSATLGAGGGAALVTSGVRVAGLPDVEETGWAPALTVAAAVSRDVLRGVVFLEGRWMRVGSARLTTLSGSSQAVLLVAGYRFDAR